ncbi:MAG: hypothetical protein HN584_01970 [Akkermansiaceae bacterium]|jgi:hypothetical protein|nr:hypothetical protein [Akkermansiaceae bacterium]MDG1854455.1 hypothetical protein [Verrucomicrobiales bacterium]
MTVQTKRILTNFTTGVAILSHALVFFLPFMHSKKALTLMDTKGETIVIGPGEPLSMSNVIGNSPLFGIIELCGVLGVMSYFFATFICKSKKRETGTGIFIGSLLLALTAPASLLPRGGVHILNAEDQFQNLEFLPTSGYIIWVISLFIGGMAIHLIANLRWHLHSQSK